MIEPTQITRIEAIERDAWLDIHAAAPPPIRAAFGIVSRRTDDGALLICRAIDHLQFNRHRDRDSTARRAGAFLREHPARGFHGRVSAAESAACVGGGRTRRFDGNGRELEAYSATCLPEPPNSAGKSANFGRPSRIGRTVSE